MKRKIFSILFALVLVLSFSLVTAVPVMAQAAPIVVGAHTNPEGTGIGITFDKDMADPAGKHLEFSFKIDGGARTFSAGALDPLDAKVIRLTVEGAAITNVDVVTVSYTLGTVVAADGGVLASFTDLPVINNLPGAAPIVVGAQTNPEGTGIGIPFNKDMAWTADQHLEFSFKIGGVARTFSAGALKIDDAKVIQLTVEGAAIANGDVVTVSYTLGTVVAADGGVLASFTDLPVINLVPGAPPIVVGAGTKPEGTGIGIQFDKDMAWTEGQHTDFSFKIDGGVARTFSAGVLNTEDATQIRLTVEGAAITNVDVVTVSYTAGTVVAADGGVLADFTDQAVTNNVPGAPPIVVDAQTYPDGTVIGIAFNKDMADPTGKHLEFSFKIGGVARTFSAGALDPLDANAILLTVEGAAIANGDVVTVSYTAGTVVAADGGVLASFTDRAVTNNVPPPADLTGLTENLAAAFDPAFAGETYAYALVATNAENSVTLTATLADATIKYSYGAVVDEVVVSGVGEIIPLDVGANVITIEVELADHVTTTYTITVTRAPPGAVNTLTITQEPTDAANDAIIVPPVTVEATDEFINVTPGVDITVSLIAGDGTLSGILMQTTDGTGVATFDDLSIDVVGADKQLRFTADSVTADSAVFEIFTATIFNSTTGQAYSTIQDAVGEASSGNIITVGPGTYVEDITISENLTLVSSGGAEVTKLTGTGLGNPVVTIGDYTVTLDGFDIDIVLGDGVYSDNISAGNVVTIENAGIHDNNTGINVAGTVYGTLNILNNIIADNTYEGIYIYEVDDGGIVVIKGNIVGAYEDADNDLDGNGDYGIYLEHVYNGSTVTIGGTTDPEEEYNLICENGGSGIYVEELYYDSTLTIEGNAIGAFAYDGYRFDGNGSEGIYVGYVDYGSTVTIRHNAIAENSYEGIYIYSVGYYVNETAAEYYALFQTYGANTVTIEENMVGAWEYDGYSFNGNGDSGIYISYANFATYITIEGNTISENQSEGMELEYFGDYGERFYVDAAGNPLITEPYTSDISVNPDYPGYFGTTVLIQGNTITDNGDYGIYQYDDWEYGTNVTIEGNTISGNKYAGIYHDYDVQYDASVTIRGNTITSNGIDGWYGGIYWSYWEYIQYGASYTVEDNLIAGNFGDGIYIEEVHDNSSLTIRNNTIGAGTDGEGNLYAGNEYGGIYLDYVYWYSSADISNNIITENNGDGIYLYEVYDYSDAVITDNIISWNDGSGIYIDYVYEYSSADISGNTIAENTSDGIYLSEVYDDSDAVITHNTIELNGGYGIYIYDVYYEYSRVDINYNNIIGNTSDGVYYAAAWFGYYNVDATYNWWGDASGPSNYGPGTGDGVSDYVVFSPWLPMPAFWEVLAMLNPGWTTLSTPITLDSASNELAELSLDFEIAYGFYSGVWVQIGSANDNLVPCDAFYVKMDNGAYIKLIPSDDYSNPKTKTLNAGWNLVSLANLSDMAAEDGLASAYLVSGDLTGYAQVMSPAVNQAAWSAVRGPAIDTALGYDMLPTEGYWVFMNNAGTLAGFTSTPITFH